MRNQSSILNFLSVLFITLFFTFSYAALNNGIILDPTSNYKIQWEIVNSDTVIIAVSVDVESWIGVGWHCPTCGTDGPMSNADFVIGTFDSNGIISVSDSVLPPNTKPPPVTDVSVGGVNNIVSYGGYQSPGKTYMIFSRPLVTGDTIGDRDLTLNQSVYFIWAHGKSNTFVAHGPGNAGITHINLSQESSSQSESSGPTPPDYVSWHASLMFLSFGILMPFGIFAGRFLKGYDWWFPVHYILQGTAFVCALIAFILIIIFVDGFDFSTTHSIFGIITLSLVLLAIGGGITSHLMWKPNRTETPIFPDIIHHWGGRIVYLMGVSTIITGMVLHQIPTASIIVFSGFVGFIFVVYAFIEIYKRRYPQKFDDETHRLINE